MKGLATEIELLLATLTVEQIIQQDVQLCKHETPAVCYSRVRHMQAERESDNDDVGVDHRVLIVVHTTETTSEKVGFRCQRHHKLTWLPRSS